MKSTLWKKSRLDNTEISEAEREAILLASAKGFALLKSLIEDNMAAVIKERSGKDSYTSPAWAYEQADLNGQERRLRQVLDILKDVCYTSPAK